MKPKMKQALKFLSIKTTGKPWNFPRIFFDLLCYTGLSHMGCLATDKYRHRFQHHRDQMKGTKYCANLVEI